jgi:hypothetical protein
MLKCSVFDQSSLHFQALPVNTKAMSQLQLIDTFLGEHAQPISRIGVEQA